MREQTPDAVVPGDERAERLRRRSQAGSAPKLLSNLEAQGAMRASIGIRNKQTGISGRNAVNLFWPVPSVPCMLGP
jgi:hypothetical protein